MFFCIKRIFICVIICAHGALWAAAPAVAGEQELMKELVERVKTFEPTFQNLDATAKGMPDLSDSVKGLKEITVNGVFFDMVNFYKQVDGTINPVSALCKNSYDKVVGEVKRLVPDCLESEPDGQQEEWQDVLRLMEINAHNTSNE